MLEDFVTYKMLQKKKLHTVHGETVGLLRGLDEVIDKKCSELSAIPSGCEGDIVCRTGPGTRLLVRLRTDDGGHLVQGEQMCAWLSGWRNGPYCSGRRPQHWAWSLMGQWFLLRSWTGMGWHQGQGTSCSGWGALAESHRGIGVSRLVPSQVKDGPLMPRTWLCHHVSFSLHWIQDLLDEKANINETGMNNSMGSAALARQHTPPSPGLACYHSLPWAITALHVLKLFLNGKLYSKCCLKNLQGNFLTNFGIFLFLF